MLVDRVGVAAADLHELHGRARLDQRRDLVHELLRERAVTELVDEPHGRSELLERDPGVAEQDVARGDRLDELDRRPARARRRRSTVAVTRLASTTVAATAASPQVMQCSDRSVTTRRSPGSRQLLLVRLAHLLEQRERLARLLLVDPCAARSRRGRAPSRRPRPPGRARSTPPAARRRSRPWRGRPRGRRSTIWAGIPRHIARASRRSRPSAQAGEPRAQLAAIPRCVSRARYRCRPHAAARLAAMSEAAVCRSKRDRARSAATLVECALAHAATGSLGPTVRDGAIVYDDLDSAPSSPDRLDGRAGRPAPTASSAATTRRASATPSARTPGSSSSSRPESASGRRPRTADGFEVEEEPLDDAPLAFLGVRSCELHAIAIQDRVFLDGRYADRDYAARREDAFVVAVELLRAGRHLLLRLDGHRAEGRRGLRPRPDRDPRRRATASSSRPAPSAARRSLAELPSRPRDRRRPRRRRRRGRAAPRADGTAARHRPTSATCSPRNLEHPRWDEVAERCLTCGNCTMVCPTCFCSSVEDATDLTGDAGRALARLGLVLLGRPLVHPRRQHPAVGAARATASGSPTSSAPGTTSSAAPAASAAGAASPGARSGSTSPRS